MPAPTFVQTVVTAFDTTTTPKDTASFNVSTGDVLVLYYAAENADPPTTPAKQAGTATIGALTLAQDVATGSVARVTGWTCTVTAGGTLTIRFARTSGTARWGGQVRTWTATAGVGVSNKASYSSTSASTVTLTGVSANSAIDCFQDDFNAAATTGHAWSATPGTPTETLFQQQNAGASHTTYSAYYANTGTAGNKAVGMTAPTQAWSLIGIEVLGSASASASNVVVHRAHTGLRMR